MMSKLSHCWLAAPGRGPKSDRMCKQVCHTRLIEGNGAELFAKDQIKAVDVQVGGGGPIDGPRSDA